MRHATEFTYKKADGSIETYTGYVVEETATHIEIELHDDYGIRQCAEFRTLLKSRIVSRLLLD